ncbi:MAG: class I SAM-dependent methyltransferase [Nanoarchaeota archaeon]|nr:class I SAM-dependent methyltransferase [Nanoarchaeota archaeon]
MSYYNKIAKGYNQLHGGEQRKKLELIKKNLSIKGLILDVGAGTGLSADYFENVILLDPSIEMLKMADGDRVVANAESLPFRDKVFDAVISVTSLHHADINEAVRGIKRVSKSGCKYAFTVLKMSKNYDKIKAELKRNFKLKEIDEEKDTILIS